jgi:hypothetical protein
VCRRAGADAPDMAAAGLSRTGDELGAPKLLEHCAAFERMIGTEGGTARARLETLLGGELASLLCRALTTRHGRIPSLRSSRGWWDQSAEIAAQPKISADY